MAATIYFIFALLSPFLWGFMNILDKYVVSHKVKNLYGFIFYAGLANVIYSLILASFLDWRFSFSQMLIPSIAGLLLGLSTFAYYHLMKKEDASHIIGLIYVYPIIVAALSFMFLGERFSMFGYAGMLLIIAGAVMISLRMSDMQSKKGLLLVGSLVIFTGVYEFLVKVSTNALPEMNGLALSLLFFGLVMMAVCIKKKIRKGIKSEFKNMKWAFFNESFTFLAILTLFLAMGGLPATIVSSIAAVQPLAVLFYEGMMHRRFGRMRKDHKITMKFLMLLMVVIGLIIMYVKSISALLF